MDANAKGYVVCNRERKKPKCRSKPVGGQAFDHPGTKVK